MADPEDVVTYGENIDDERHQGGLHLVGPGNAHQEAEEEHEVDKHRALKNVGWDVGVNMYLSPGFPMWCQQT